MANDFSVNVKIHGAKEFEQMLLAIGRVPAGRAGSAAVRAGAQVFADKMKVNIAARGLVNTGDMLASIKVTEDAAAKKSPSEVRVAYAGSSLWYSKFSEFGTARQSPKSWARPAFDEGVVEAVTALGTELGAAIEREATRLIKSAAKVP